MYFCKKCNQVCDKDEVDIIEGHFEGDWIEVHTKCNEEVKFI